MLYYFVNYVYCTWDTCKCEPVEPTFFFFLEMCGEKVKLNQLTVFAFSSPSWPHLWRSSCKGQTSSGSGLQWCGSLRRSPPTGEMKEKKVVKNSLGDIFSFNRIESLNFDLTYEFHPVFKGFVTYTNNKASDTQGSAIECISGWCSVWKLLRQIIQ